MKVVSPRITSILKALAIGKPARFDLIGAYHFHFCSLLASVLRVGDFR